MAFFTRPNIEDRQMVQYSGDTITLSGSTNIHQVGYFRIEKGAQPGLVATALDTDGTVGWGPISGISWSISACTSPLYVNHLVSCPSSAGTILVTSSELQLNGNLVFLSALSAGTNNDKVLVIDSGGYVKIIPTSGITPDILFTGNTSASCITDLWLTNLHGCSPITIHDQIQYYGSTASTQYATALGFSTISSGNYSFTQGISTTASGLYSSAFGSVTTSSGEASFSEGNNTTASGDYSHAEGDQTTASASSSHSEGTSTVASGNYSHAEGLGTTASGIASHAEGYGSQAVGISSHAEGGDQFNLINGGFSSGIGSHSEGAMTVATGYTSHAEGYATYALGAQAHSEGFSTYATGDNSHVEGLNNVASGHQSHAEGGNGFAIGEYSHSEGNGNQAIGNHSHAEGSQNYSNGLNSHAEGTANQATGDNSHAEGSTNVVTGNQSHVEGTFNVVTGDNSHGEGALTVASGSTSHAEGGSTIAGGAYSHAEGNNTKAFGDLSHAEGEFSTSAGYASHAEGSNTVAQGSNSHAEGVNAQSIGNYSHAEGNTTQSVGISSHAQNNGTIAYGDASHAGGTTSIASGLTSFVHSRFSTVDSDYGAILGGQSNYLTQSATNSIILGGTGITGTSSDTVYVPSLSVATLSNNDVLTQVLVRDSDGTLKYRDASTIGTGTGATNTYVTGFTYNNANKLTISQNSGRPDLSVSIDTFTGLTVNGLISTTSISASTYSNIPPPYKVDRLTGGTSYTFTDFNSVNIITVNNNTTTTVNLASNPRVNDFFTVKVRHDASLYPVTVSGSTKNIDGSSYVTMTITNSSYLFLYDGNEYIII